MAMNASRNIAKWSISKTNVRKSSIFKWLALPKHSVGLLPVRAFLMLFFIPFEFYIWYLCAVAYKESTRKHTHNTGTTVSIKIHPFDRVITKVCAQCSYNTIYLLVWQYLFWSFRCQFHICSHTRERAPHLWCIKMLVANLNCVDIGIAHIWIDYCIDRSICRLNRSPYIT